MSPRTARLELVRATNLTIRADLSLEELYRTRFEGRPPKVREEGDTVAIEYPRAILSWDRRKRASWVTLSASVPWLIEARTGVAKLTADLGALSLRGFKAPEGVIRSTLVLPRPSGEVSVRTGAAGEVTIHRPAGVAARVRVDGGASQLTLDDQRFRAVGGELNWQTPDFDRAADRYDINVSRGARRLVVDTLAPSPAPTGPTGRALVAVLFTDIVGSTERAREVGDLRWRELLDLHDRTTRHLVAEASGRLVKTTGDGILATFDGPGSGIRCALALRGELAQSGIDIRAGLHMGEVELRGDDVGGIAVHIASRITDAAAPGEVLVSRTVRDLVAGSEVMLQDRGMRSLEGVGDWQLFSVA
jgi:class 3 adenylate cyclase